MSPCQVDNHGMFDVTLLRRRVQDLERQVGSYILLHTTEGERRLELDDFQRQDEQITQAERQLAILDADREAERHKRIEAEAALGALAEVLRLGDRLVETKVHLAAAVDWVRRGEAMIICKQAERCVTHHHACDCREYQFQAALAVRERVIAAVERYSQPTEGENLSLRLAVLNMFKALLMPTGDAASEHLPPPKPEQPLPPDYTERGTSAMKLTDKQRNALKILVDKPSYAPLELTHRVYPFGSAFLTRLEQRGLVEHAEGLDIGVSEFRWRITPAGRAAIENTLAVEARSDPLPDLSDPVFEGRPGTDSPRGEFG